MICVCIFNKSHKDLLQKTIHSSNLIKLTQTQTISNDCSASKPILITDKFLHQVTADYIFLFHKTWEKGHLWLFPKIIFSEKKETLNSHKM